MLIEDLLSSEVAHLDLELMHGNDWLRREISLAEVHRPGLALTGFLKKFAFDRILVFGNSELLFLSNLDPSVQKARLDAILTEKTPVVIVAGRQPLPPAVREICKQKGVPLLRTGKATTEFIASVSVYLAEAIAPTTSCHGTLVEAFGVGVLIQGESSIGKSEAALGLIERGHRLISDDVVKLKKRKDGTILGTGSELNKHVMEIRGIGIINVAHLYGAVCVRDHKSLDVIVKLEEWDDQVFYDRIGLDEKFLEILGENIPYHILPVKPGRDVVLLIETIVLNHRLKSMGYHSAKEFNVKLLETISRKQKERETLA